MCRVQSLFHFFINVSTEQFDMKSTILDLVYFLYLVLDVVYVY